MAQTLPAPVNALLGALDLVNKAIYREASKQTEEHYVDLIEFDKNSALFTGIKSGKDYTIEPEIEGNLYNEIISYCQENDLYEKRSTSFEVNLNHWDYPECKEDVTYINEYALTELHNESFVTEAVENFISDNFGKWKLMEE